MKKSTLIAASLQFSGLLLLTVFFTTFVYTTLHEGGHALAALLSGGTVGLIDVNFLNFSAHAVLDGTFTNAQQALISVSGWALPVLVYLIFLGITRSGRNLLLIAVRWIGGVSVLGSTLPWVVLPLVYLSGERPADDVISFVIFSGLPPILVALVFAALVAGGIALIVAGWGQVSAIHNWSRQPESPMANPTVRRTLAGMALLAAVLAGSLLWINRDAQTAVIPAGYRLAAEFDLAQADRAGVTLYAFDQTEAGPLGLLVLARNVRTDYLDVSITGPENWSFPILHGEGYSTVEDRSNPAWGELPAGRYAVVLTGSPARGKILVYVKP
ncbi:peptidase M50B-like [Longilinea arvoryzae]|uniref:Peptidase M50B-like n=1 Tax=Longilinea arvoryzae TaxID=360412 RepID=A0A0S7B5R1_9CHLR|nr:M50 family metallopeptidase [Longilinea arvoryzae]GAP12508.1 peptidase M50B-like [Longilinea arvoryzae]